MEDFCDIFGRQAAKNPDKTALVFDGRKMTYKDLDDKSNRVAIRLKEMGVREEIRAGIYMERSFEMIISLISVLKAGGAYVPLDGSYPQSRLEFILEDSGTDPILTSSAAHKKIREIAKDRKIVVIDDLMTGNDPVDRPDSGINLESTAYVIYTSGSTGKPKGVMMGRKPLLNLIKWQIDAIPEVSNNTLQFSPISFDVSFQEIFSTLCSGGTLILCRDDTRQNAVSLLKYLRDERITRVFLPFIALQQLAKLAPEVLLPGFVHQH